MSVVGLPIQTEKDCPVSQVLLLNAVRLSVIDMIGFAVVTRTSQRDYLMFSFDKQPENLSNETLSALLV